MITRRRHRVRRAIIWTGLAISLAATLLEVTGVKDQWSFTALIYYATPWLLRWLFGLFACRYGWKDDWMRRLAVVTVVCAAIQGFSSLSFSRPQPVPEGALEVSTWNAGHVLHQRRDLWPAASEGDICAIVETGKFTEDEWAAFTASQGEESWLRLDGGTAIGVKGKIVGSETIHPPKANFRAFKVKVSLPRRDEFEVIVVDINSQPWLDREEALRTIRDAVGSDTQCIILGDFNTPSQSTWLRKWRKSGFTLANDGRRPGFRETWPYGIPLWTLDQIWTGPGWETSSTRHTRYGSDHAKVTAILTVRAAMGF